MSVFDDFITKAKTIADKNGDGKIDAADFEALKADLDDETKKKVDEFQNGVDTNNDGKIDVQDLQAFGGDIGSKLNEVKDKVFGK